MEQSTNQHNKVMRVHAALALVAGVSYQDYHASYLGPCN
jgi:hypothetical protein